MRLKCLLTTWFAFGCLVSQVYGADPGALPDWLRERRTEALQHGPGGLVDLACDLFDRSRQPDRFVYAFRMMQDAADLGDDAGALYLSAYLRLGVGTTKNADAADRILMNLVVKIREKQSTRFATVQDAANAIYSGKCGPSDIVTSTSLNQLEKNCQAAEGPKPRWCT